MNYIEHQVGTLTVTQRTTDGYINASRLTKAYEKKTGKYRNPNSWFENDRPYHSMSQPFISLKGKGNNSGKIAVKVINHYGDEVLKIYFI